MHLDQTTLDESPIIRGYVADRDPLLARIATSGRCTWTMSRNPLIHCGEVAIERTSEGIRVEAMSNYYPIEDLLQWINDPWTNPVLDALINDDTEFEGNGDGLIDIMPYGTFEQSIPIPDPTTVDPRSLINDIVKQTDAVALKGYETLTNDLRVLSRVGDTLTALRGTPVPPEEVTHLLAISQLRPQELLQQVPRWDAFVRFGSKQCSITAQPLLAAVQTQQITANAGRDAFRLRLKACPELVIATQQEYNRLPPSSLDRPEVQDQLALFAAWTSLPSLDRRNILL